MWGTESEAHINLRQNTGRTFNSGQRLFDIQARTVGDTRQL